MRAFSALALRKLCSSRFSVMWYMEIPVRDSELDRDAEKKRRKTRWIRLKIGTGSILRYWNMKPTPETHSQFSVTVISRIVSEFQKTTAQFPYESSIPFIFATVKWVASDRSFLRRFSVGIVGKGLNMDFERISLPSDSFFFRRYGPVRFPYTTWLRILSSRFSVMWCAESRTGIPNWVKQEKKTHQIVSDPSQNWYAIQPIVFGPKSNLKFSPGSKNNFTVENRKAIEPWQWFLGPYFWNSNLVLGNTTTECF